MNVKIIFIVVVVLVTGFLAGYGVGSSKYFVTTTTVFHTMPQTISAIYTSTATITDVAPPTTITRTATSTTTTTRTVTETRTATARETVAVTTTTTRTVTETRTATARETVAVVNNVSIDVVVDEEYFSKLFNLILNANKSIYVAIYVVKYDSYEFNDPVNILLYAIIDARNRGVDVRVIVDDATLKSYPETIEFLKTHGVPVKLDESGSTTMHAKIVIVDGLYVFVGSHNWTESGLSYNREVSVLIKSNTIAQQLEEYFNKIWNHGRTL